MGELWTEETQEARPAPAPARERDYIDLLLGRIRSTWPWMGLLVLTGILGGALGAWNWPIRYQAITVVFLVQSMRAETQQQELLGSGPRPNQAYAAAILRSKTVAEDVLRSLKIKDRDPAELQGNLEVAGTRDGLFQVSFRDKDPQAALQILAEYLKAYRRYTDGSILTVAKNERVFIEKQLKQCEEQLLKAESDLLGFEQDHAQLEQADSVKSALTTAYGERYTAQTALRQVDAKRGDWYAKAEQSLRQLSTSVTSTSTLEDSLLSALQSQVLGARLELQMLLVTATEADPEVKAAREKLGRLQREADRRVAELKTGFHDGSLKAAADADDALHIARVRLEAAEDNLRELRPKLKPLLRDDIQRVRLRRAFDIQDKLYRELKVALQGAQLAESREPIYLVALDSPSLITSPFQQRRYPILVLAGALVGGALAVSLVAGLAVRDFLA